MNAFRLSVVQENHEPHPIPAQGPTSCCPWGHQVGHLCLGDPSFWSPAAAQLTMASIGRWSGACPGWWYAMGAWPPWRLCCGEQVGHGWPLLSTAGAGACPCPCPCLALLYAGSSQAWTSACGTGGGCVSICYPVGLQEANFYFLDISASCLGGYLPGSR